MLFSILAVMFGVSFLWFVAVSIGYFVAVRREKKTARLDNLGGKGGW
jgi:hypothetical protein